MLKIIQDLSIATTTTTKSTTNSTFILLNFTCYFNWNLFLGGKNFTQGNGTSLSNAASQGVNGYWYSSDSMNIEMCISSCLNSNFNYAVLTS